MSKGYLIDGIRQVYLKLVWLCLVPDCTKRHFRNCCLNINLLAVMVVKRYRSRKTLLILLTICIICYLYYISLNDNNVNDNTVNDNNVNDNNVNVNNVNVKNANVNHVNDTNVNVNNINDTNVNVNNVNNTNVNVNNVNDTNVNVNNVNDTNVYVNNVNDTNVNDNIVIDNKWPRQTDPNITRRYIEHNIEEALKEDKGGGCEIPQMDPYAREVAQFDNQFRLIRCKGKDWVKCYHSECRVVNEILSTTVDIVCNYQDIIHVSDNEYYLGGSTEVIGNKPYILNVSDHVKIKCTGTHRKRIFKSTWIGYSVGFRKSVPRIHSPPNRTDALNIIMFGFDSTSKNGFIRQMPKSYEYLKNHAKATILNGYNIVGDGTPHALFPLLTGKAELEMPDVRKRPKNNRSMDSLPFIFYKLTKDGYRTAYFEDAPWGGTFQFRFNGFRHQPVDHYLRSFLLEEFKNGTKWRNARSKHCVGDTPTFQLMMNITDQFMRLDGKRFCLTFVSDITHDYSMLLVADDPMLNLLRSLEQRNVFEDTLLIVFGDHGPRFAKVRDTLQGKLEERLPFMSIRLPEKFKRMRPNAQAQLEGNANILTTAHDIHATILDVLDWRKHMNPLKVTGADFPRAMTLLEPIPRNRSCSEAGIQTHFCTCVNWKNVTDSKMIHKTVDAFVNYINELTESFRSRCVPRTLTQIQWVMRQTPNRKLLSFVASQDYDNYLGKFGAKPKILKETYQIKVVVGPGHSIYEATMTYLKKEDKFLINTRDISRTNAYGNEPSCVSATHPHLSPYCYCNDYVRHTV